MNASDDVVVTLLTDLSNFKKKRFCTLFSVRIITTFINKNYLNKEL